MHLYENPSATPRAFVVHQVSVVPDTDAAEATFAAASERFPNGALRLTGFDITERAVVEAGAEELPASLVGDTPSCDGTTDRVEITAYDSDEVRVDVDSACAGLLVLSDTYFPGWQATVDGRSATIHPTNMAFRGVVVGAGRSEVVFRYHPPAFRAGIYVAIAAIVAMVATGLVPAIRRRRRDGTGRRVSSAAVFLDRDGVLMEPMVAGATERPPWNMSELRLVAGAAGSLERLRRRRLPARRRHQSTRRRSRPRRHGRGAADQ